MKQIPGGTFQMGDSTYSKPVHTVNVSTFWMDSTEVTQSDYYAVTGVNPSYHSGNTSRPVEMVTWFDAVLYCNARSKRDGRDTVYRYTSVSGSAYQGCRDLSGLVLNFSKIGYRLPTEAEWEYAYRAGTTTAYYWSNTWDQPQADTYCWNNNNSRNSTYPVGTKLPNAWGLYDMAGNVWEWCNDWLESYTADTKTNPMGPSTGSYRVLRGGAWVGILTSPFCAWHRYNGVPRGSSNIDGFRVVCR
ncbi:MAG: formylglycine-generating enzyme family protein [Fibrobacteres bacterium]|nr:formylglycine-generating enzyme family protein [Fibrobacterota bacterium]